MPRIPSGKQTNGPFIVDLPIKIGDFPVRYVNVYQRVFSSTPHVGIQGLQNQKRSVPEPPPSGATAGCFPLGQARPGRPRARK